jgi:hypothetical protein
VVCGAALARAERLDEWWIDLCVQLGVSLNELKHQRCAQSVEYAGLRFDTFRGLLLVLPDTLASLLVSAESLGVADAVWTQRLLDRVKGRLLHYSVAISHLRILVTELGRLMGPVSEELYDQVLPTPPGLGSLSSEICNIIRRFAPSGRPLWPIVPSSAYAALLRGDEQHVLCSLTWDASPHGWAAVARWWDHSGLEPVLMLRLFIGTWPAGWAVLDQAHREALGGALAFEAFALAVDIRGRVCILRNDASAAVAAFRKGSSQSPEMQRCAMYISRVAAASNVEFVPWHVPGLLLVAEGVDGASRSGTDFGEHANLDAVLGPAVGPSLWTTVEAVAAAAGWHITVDALASESNARAPRFWSHYHEPGCEAVDALSVLDWAQSDCPSCGVPHGDILYAFPPPQLVRAVVRKACADGARCVLVMAVAILAPHWHKLLAASVLPRSSHPEGFVRIRSPRPLLLHAAAYAPTELAVFACDFGRISPRPNLPPPSSCPGSFLRRHMPACGSASDYSDRARLREALLAVRDPRWTAAAETREDD